MKRRHFRSSTGALKSEKSGVFAAIGKFSSCYVVEEAESIRNVSAVEFFHAATPRNDQLMYESRSSANEPLFL